MTNSRWKKLALAGVSVVALGATSLAVAQIVTPTLVQTIYSNDLFQDISRGTSSTINVYATASQLRSWILGQNSGQAGTPTLTTSTSVCGGTTATINGSGVSGQVAEGTTASTSCVLTFPIAYVTAPECFVSLNGVADTALKCATTQTTLTVTQTSASSNLLNYLLVGLPGG